MNLTHFQTESQRILREGRDLLLVAPTGLGKTLAVTADLQERFCKIVYAVPLRALGSGIHGAISELGREGLHPVIHHGDQQESVLFGEEVVITTYDQVVCGVPGLPLSLPLKAGHAVAGALLMARLIFDEVHLAWAISRESLSILLGIIQFRRKLGLQTIVLTATLPTDVAEAMRKALGAEALVRVVQREVRRRSIAGRRQEVPDECGLARLARAGQDGDRAARKPGAQERQQTTRVKGHARNS